MKRRMCKKCRKWMKPGKAIQNTYVGVQDFPGDTHITTMSPGGPGKLIDCLKCPQCGYSVTMEATCQQEKK